MKFVLIAIALLLTSFVSAAIPAYDLQMDLSIDGKQVSSPRILVKEGATASVLQDVNGQKTYLDVVATKDPKNKSYILMKFEIGTISPTGEKKMISTPQILARENNRSKISVGDANGKEEVSVSITATKRSL